MLFVGIVLGSIRFELDILVQIRERRSVRVGGVFVDMVFMRYVVYLGDSIIFGLAS